MGSGRRGGSRIDAVGHAARVVRHVLHRRGADDGQPANGPVRGGVIHDGVGAPTADFDYTVSGLTVSFHDESTTETGYKPSSLWTFGDGQTSEDENPQHTYASPGTYTVKLVVTDQQGLKAERTKQVAVSG